MPKKLFLTGILILIAGFVLTGCSSLTNSNSNGVVGQSQTGPVSGSQDETFDTTQDIVSADKYVRTDKGEGGVQVEALWMSPEYFRLNRDENLAENKFDLESNIIFEITMTTHMGDLTQYPILDKAELNVDGTVLKPAEWEYSSSSSHHPIGLLIFEAKDENGNPLVKQSRLELNLKDLRDIPERKFTWE